MPAAIQPRVVLGAAAVLYAAVFAAFAVIPTDDVGIPHVFYVAIALVAVVTGPLWGALAGAAAAALYCIGMIVHPIVPSAEILTGGTLVRLATYGCTGALIGWFARDNRRLVAELRILADRDSVTGLPNTRAFEAAIQRRLDTERSFALLIGDLRGVEDVSLGEDVAANDALLRIGDLLGNAVGPGDDLARVGGRAFAVLTSLGSAQDAARLASRLERTLAGHSLPIRFGWAVFPHEGTNALSLYRAADERLYARKLVSSDAAATTLRSVS
jgi:diguanylate cyclase (GGDEF)-like protein